MAQDARMKRGSLICKSLEVRDSFGFAAPTQVLGAIKLFAFDLYGGMLWRPDSEEALLLAHLCQGRVGALQGHSHHCQVAVQPSHQPQGGPAGPLGQVFPVLS